MQKIAHKKVGRREPQTSLHKIIAKVITDGLKGIDLYPYPGTFLWLRGKIMMWIIIAKEAIKDYKTI